MTPTTRITALMMRTGVEILAERREGLRARELWPLMLQRLPGLEQDWDDARTGRTSAKDNFLWYSIDLVKSGWIRKTGGRWFVTGVGRWALHQWTSPDAFYQAARRGYQEWDRNKDAFDLAKRLISAVPEGHWASAEEMANDLDLPTETLLHWLQGERPEGWHRILDPLGRIPAEAYALDDEREEWLGLLAEDAINVEQGRADPLVRVPGGELRNLITDPEEDGEEPPLRAWLVRGTGSVIQNVWLPTGTCSLRAAWLRTLTPGMAFEQIKAAVDNDVAHADAPERARMATELHAFLNRVRKDDIVVTNDGSRVYLGTITGDASFDSGHLRRGVRWHDPDRPRDFGADLPDEFSARVSNPDAELIDLTEFVGDLLPLLGRPAETVSREVHLPDVPAEVAEELLVPQEWLAECVELLRERPQLIFYGPPGTGKTYLAQHLAEHLTSGRPQNVQLVQFHPAYSYEDFFEGYRPREGKDGTVAFELVWGPLRRLASAAHANPGEPYVLIIDEINRGNLAKIFGELYFLLEYRGKGVNLLYGTDKGTPFTLPRNLIVLGTMNTADRSIALVDTAMRRRFWFQELHPSEEPTRSMLSHWLEREGLDDMPARLLAELNRRIDDRDFQVGPSYLMRRSASTEEGLERIWRAQILPLMEEFHYGDGTDVRSTYGLEALRSALG